MSIRQPVKISVAGREYKVTPNFAFIDKVEERFDLVSFATRLEAGEFRISDIVHVLHSALVENGHDVDRNRLGDLILENQDFDKAAQSCADLVGAVFGAGPEKELPENAGGDEGEQSGKKDEPSSLSTTE